MFTLRAKSEKQELVSIEIKDKNKKWEVKKFQQLKDIQKGRKTSVFCK